MRAVRPGDGRRRWTVRCRDLLSRTTVVVIEVDPAGYVCVHLARSVVLRPADVRRLQQHLGDALARALSDGADYD